MCIVLERSSRISCVKGVGKKTEELLNKLSIFTVDDLLTFYPRSYLRYEQPIKINNLLEEDTVAVYGQVVAPLKIEKSFRKNKTIITGQIKDETGVLSLIWFNAPFLRNVLRKGEHYVFYGKIKRNRNNSFIMEQPKYYKADEYKKMQMTLMPVYSKTEGLTNNAIIKIVKQVLAEIPDKRDYLSDDLRKKFKLAAYNFSIRNIHFPLDEENLKNARTRLIFDEFFIFLYNIRRLKGITENQNSQYLIDSFDKADLFYKGLPYKLTNAQIRVWEEIKREMSSGKVMRRLIQGDVGSGKTIIAVLALIAIAQSGFQGSLMAPTEVLAKQHYDSISNMLKAADISINIALLTGSTKISEKKKIYSQLSNGEISIVIGTHAIIQKGVIFKDLGLVITDEQHRFGVNQRESLSDKGKEPHVIVMSATPIPRTLALIIYGDMDISVIDEMPADRIPIKNCVVNTNYRNTAYKFILNEINNGRQAYVICPLIENNENIDAEDVISYCDNLKEIFPESVKCEYLHGRMNNEEKNHIMEKFANHEIDVLVSTTVIEVGINVPNATVMLIENAEKFGLATLHQLRGRVGRGKYQSYCIMIKGIDNDKTSERLDILNKSNDGFYIASKDLMQRGSGDLFGYRQSGEMAFELADIYDDADILKTASDAVDLVLRENKPEIERFVEDTFTKKYLVI